MIKDADGFTVTYLPLSLEAGQESAVISLKVTPSGTNQKLKGRGTPEAALLGRIAGGGAFVDLSAGGLSLAYGLETAVEIKVVAGAISGVRRVSLSLSVPESGAAGWSL